MFVLKSVAFISMSFMLCRIKSKLMEQLSGPVPLSPFLLNRIKEQNPGVAALTAWFHVNVTCICVISFMFVFLDMPIFCPEENKSRNMNIFITLTGKK